MIIYLSTFNTDLILVQESLAEQAVVALQTHQTNTLKRSSSKQSLSLSSSSDIPLSSSPPAAFKFISAELDSAASADNVAVLSLCLH
jgi:hypothetical protein